MALPLGLISKSLVGLVSVGAVGGGSWVLWDKNSWTQLDREVFEGSGEWSWTATPTSDTTITAGTTELKIEASTSHSSKNWTCTIKGELPNPLEDNATSKISEQLSAIKNALGVGTNGSWNPSSDETKKTAAKKFFSYCIKNRTWEEWWTAKGGGGANSTIHMEIKKVEDTSTDYKFNEEAFKKLYETT